MLGEPSQHIEGLVTTNGKDERYHPSHPMQASSFLVVLPTSLVQPDAGIPDLTLISYTQAGRWQATFPDLVRRTRLCLQIVHKHPAL
jgi:hypothetical protein